MITTEKHLLYILKVSRQQLDSIIENIDKYYSTWEKPKLNKDTNKPLYNSDGTIKKRTINSTNKELKVIQKRLYNYLLSKITLPNYFLEVFLKRIIFLTLNIIKVINMYLLLT